MHHTQTGTPYYASPEMWKDKPYDAKSDIWSLGCIFYEVASLSLPFLGKNLPSLYRKIIEGKFQDLPKMYSADLSNLIKNLLQVQAFNRPACGIY